MSGKVMELHSFIPLLRTLSALQMRAMTLNKVSDLRTEHQPLVLQEVDMPIPAEDEVLIKVSVCGICHTELDEIEGRTPPSSYPMIPGHQVVGTVEEAGDKVHDLSKGDRVGVAWIFSACGECAHCKKGEENVCDKFVATGRDANGGYAEYMIVPAAFVYNIPEQISDAEAAPLLCAGAIGYRSLRLTGLGNGQVLGLTGFGASGHLVLKLARHLYPNSTIYVFARSEEERAFALELGAVWAGDTMGTPPTKCHAIIDTTPVWKPVVKALEDLEPGGRLVINAIRKEEVDKEELLKLSYPEHLWLEKEIKSVANITRQDVREFLEMAARIPIKPEYQLYPLEEANKALLELKEGKIRGAKVLVVHGSVIH